jgi:selenocysteine lyase/cysteine desulfurase
MLGVRLPEPARSVALSSLAALNCFAALRGETLRISPHLHTTPEDIERLQDGLRRVTRGG